MTIPGLSLKFDSLAHKMEDKQEKVLEFFSIHHSQTHQDFMLVLGLQVLIMVVSYNFLLIRPCDI